MTGDGLPHCVKCGVLDHRLDEVELERDAVLGLYKRALEQRDALLAAAREVLRWRAQLLFLADATFPANAAMDELERVAKACEEGK